MALQGIYFSSPKVQKQYDSATKHPKGIMNDAYDHPEGPQTPSFGGSYAPRDDRPSAAYSYQENGTSRPHLPSSSSTLGFTPPKEQKRKNRCGAKCILIPLLVLFIILFLVMVVLYFKRDSSSEKENVNGNNPTDSEVKQTPSPPCLSIPKPVPFATLPERLKTELKQLEALIIKQVELGGPMAVTSNIVYMNKVIWEGEYGVMNNSETPKRKPSVTAILPLASVSKVLTVLMLFKLHNDGFVNSLDDPVNKYQSDFSVKNPFGNDPITLRQLASHRSGLPREAPCYPETKSNLCPRSNDQMIQRLKNVTLLRAPGTEPYYSNLGVALLGRVLGERFGNGAGYEGWIKNNLLDSFEMTDTSFVLDDSIKKRIPVGYFRPTEFSNIKEWGWLNPTGGVFSTVTDFAKCHKLHSWPRCLQLIQLQYLTHFPLRFAEGYVLGDGKSVVGTPWEITILDDLLLRMKGGDVFGYHAAIQLLPELKLAFNLFCTHCEALRYHFIEQFNKNFIPALKDVLRNEAKKKIVLPPDTKPFIGVYRVDGLAYLRFLEVKLKEGQLFISINGQYDAFLLNYTKPLTFTIILPSSLPCVGKFSLGVDNDLVVFDIPSNVDGLCDKFTMYSAAPSGRTFFYRKRD
ncbi:putative beta-lactamase-like 1 [Stylophora pistillata]|uniref:putative beta-lactamase-like 1 n=1 Tax=Stylophora pistillata TaxID=50429 RepID=UPI000C041E52|nr:putative beta-lactamase-like 1 [Stylophora pistillata]